MSYRCQRPVRRHCFWRVAKTKGRITPKAAAHIALSERPSWVDMTHSFSPRHDIGIASGCCSADAPIEMFALRISTLQIELHAEYIQYSE